MTKSELRAEMRGKRRAFVATRGGNGFTSDSLADITYNLRINKDIIISTYIASAPECDVNPWLLAQKNEGTTLALPCADSKAEPLVFRRWDQAAPLVRSPLGFPQPPGSGPGVTPDLILTPLLAFDEKLGRLGQGAGHYDRAFAQFPGALRIGVAWSVQQVEAVPLDPWDVPLDAVITEKALFRASTSRMDSFHAA
jgi:5-formyltetrahydrofolate cyclo-ligase